MDGQVVNGRSMQVGDDNSRTRITCLAVGLPSPREAKVPAEVLLSNPIDRSIAVRWLLPLQVVRGKSDQLRIRNICVRDESLVCTIFCLYYNLFVNTF